MDTEIKKIRLKFNCDVDWNSMLTSDGGRHCNSCNKKVYDFTNAKQYEFLQILAENGNNVCGRFKLDQMDSQPIRVPTWKKWVSAALVLIGLNVLNNKVIAQGKPLPPKHKQIKFLPPAVLGDVEVTEMNGIVSPPPMAAFPGGQKALTDFISKHIKYSKNGKEGRVIVQFDVKTDGSLNNFKILKSVGAVNNTEVIRVLKLSPKWKPSKLNGKPVVCRYTLPVNFQH